MNYLLNTGILEKNGMPGLGPCITFMKIMTVVLNELMEKETSDRGRYAGGL